MRLARLLVPLALLSGLLGVAPPAGAGLTWNPAVGTTWHIQFAGTLDTSNPADVYDVDAFETTAETVAALHTDGHHVVCYVNAGAWENWRDDKDDFPSAARGKALDGWEGERWLDIRNLEIRPALEARMDLCVTKGFDGIEFDNVDGYQNRTGFPLTGAEQVAFNTWLADEAKQRDLTPGLKNALGIVDELVDDFSFAINEQCLQYHECALLQPFIDANKPVFHIEYKGKVRRICNRAPDSFSTLKKKRSLNAFYRDCL